MAGMMKLVDIPDLGSGFEGSSPSIRITYYSSLKNDLFFSY